MGTLITVISFVCILGFIAAVIFFVVNKRHPLAYAIMAVFIVLGLISSTIRDGELLEPFHIGDKVTTPQAEVAEVVAKDGHAMARYPPCGQQCQARGV